MSFKNITFILHKPQLSENIGACARALKNFNFNNLSIVNPKPSFPNDKIIATSVGAKDIIKKAIKSRKAKKITVEVDNLKQLKKINGLKFDRILFDNMNYKNLTAGVKLAKKLYETEASGGVTLNNVRKIAKTGVDRISIGVLTHNINSLDLKLEI